MSPTSFDPDPVVQPANLPDDAPSTDDVSPQTVTLPAEQLAALGLAGAQAGQKFTINLTVNKSDEMGADVSVDSSEANEAPPAPDALADPSDPTATPPDALPPPMPPKPKPAIVGPDRLKGKSFI